MQILAVFDFCGPLMCQKCHFDTRIFKNLLALPSARCPPPPPVEKLLLRLWYK